MGMVKELENQLASFGIDMSRSLTSFFFFFWQLVDKDTRATFDITADFCVSLTKWHRAKSRSMREVYQGHTWTMKETKKWEKNWLSCASFFQDGPRGLFAVRELKLKRGGSSAPDFFCTELKEWFANQHTFYLNC